MGKIVSYEANTTRVVIDGIEVTLLADVRMEDDYAPEPVSGIGDIHMTEYYPTRAMHRATINGVIRRDEQRVADQIFLENGDAALERKTFEIELFDKRSGVMLRKLESAQHAGGNVSVTAHRIALMAANFVAIDATGDLNSGAVLDTPAVVNA
jgi:hypothetical protein